ncbi:MAG: hypothetical protein IT330_08350 [Anaerolineae bacterium]|nr:hypothetical protein [Anaerolineae bacterium]
MRFGNLEIDPARNPAILDTATWDTEAAWRAVRSLADAYWQSVQDAAAHGSPLPSAPGCIPYTPSCTHHGGSIFFLMGLADGQQVFVEVGEGEGETVLGAPASARQLSGGNRLALYKTDAAVLDRFFRFVRPEAGSRALGAVPRLGIGTRMTTSVWSGVWQAMHRGGFAANAIQNSVRELNLLPDLLAGRPPDVNIAFGFGRIETGYTGSTFEGLWVAGALAALQSDTRPTYGADADHIQVKRGPDGLARAKRVAQTARYYSFFTLDVSDVLDYGALAQSAAMAADYLAAKIPQSGQRRAILAYHQQRRRIGGQDHAPDETTIGRLVGKHWDALDAVQGLYGYIKQLKEGFPFDLELSIDEHPPEVDTFACLTTDEELTFLLLEMQRREIPLTHIAPNFGIEKGTDYRCPDGLAGLESRARTQARIAADLGVMPDFHSGDDLTAATRRAIARATRGRNHFKISPSLQLLFAEVLSDYHPALFRRWWEDALGYAQREAAASSAFAADCLRQYEASDKTPSAHQSVFHHYSFAFVGRRDATGQFLHRQEFYDLSPGFYQAYQNRVAGFLGMLATELFNA